MKHIKIYDKNMYLLTILENATNKCYAKKLNAVWSAQFSLPADDPKVSLCAPFNIIELFDGDERVDLFRILPSSTSYDESGSIITFNCEHVLASLMDDVLFQYHECVGLTPINVINYVLGFQTIYNWTVGTVDFDYVFSYKWESENLLGSIFSIPKPFTDEYVWTWNTATYPWVLNLVAPDSEIRSYIRYGRNLRSIEKVVDPSKLATRLYGLGYGEGVNQLTISGVNGGVPYIEADTSGTYGTISRIYTDTKEENATTLKAKMLAELEKMKIPKIEYRISAAHLYQITKENIDNFYLASNCEVVDTEDSIKFTARVVGISKRDLDNSPGDIDIEIANNTENIADSISALSDRQRINEVYSQGATNMLAYNYSDNADSLQPALLKFYIPSDVVRINKMELNLKVSNFRAYSRSIEGGGGTSTSTSSGGGATQTSNDGSWTLTPGLMLPSDFMGVVQDHSHPMNSVSHVHDVAIPGHSHDVTVPSHIHGIQYGIYLRNILPSSITVKVDGNTVPNLSLEEDGVNIIPYLSVDENGKINRGTWHEISITPNDLARIEANIVTQMFIQSRGGGNY